MAKRRKTEVTDKGLYDFVNRHPNTDSGNDTIDPEFECQAFAVALPAYKQTQDRLIRLEISLLGRLTALADEIETGTSGSPRPVPAPPYLSLSDFNKTLPFRLVGLQEDLEHQISRIRSLLF